VGTVFLFIGLAACGIALAAPPAHRRDAAGGQTDEEEDGTHNNADDLVSKYYKSLVFHRRTSEWGPRKLPKSSVWVKVRHE
jgi:hypothetical protein